MPEPVVETVSALAAFTAPVLPVLTSVAYPFVALTVREPCMLFRFTLPVVDVTASPVPPTSDAF